MAKRASKRGSAASSSKTSRAGSGRQTRTFRSIDEVRQTYYPDAFGRMQKRRRQTGMDRLGHSDSSDSSSLDPSV